MAKTLTFRLQPGGSLNGTAVVPGDKSISHRSIMLAALAQGTSHISGFLEGEDSLRTLQAFRLMGVNITLQEGAPIMIEGVGMQGLQAPSHPIDLGNSGTAMRLMCGLLAAQSFDSVLVGDDSLSQRPMRRVTEPLQRMAARIEPQENGCPPIHIKGGQQLKAIDYAVPVASAQIKSCLLLAGLYAEGETRISEPGITRDHTERMLKAFGYPLKKEANSVSLVGGGRLVACDISVPADISSAAFFMVGGCIASDSELILKRVGLNPTRTGIVELLKMMGADIELSEHDDTGFEPVADIRIRSSVLKGIEVPEHLVPLAIDEFPALFIAAACANGTTVLSNAKELRVKESDRIQVMADGLVRLGVDASPTEDGMIIQGKPGAFAFRGGEIHSHGDHRIAMAFSMAALRCQAEIVIHDCDNVNTSFPGFAQLAAAQGLNIQESE